MVYGVDGSPGCTIGHEIQTEDIPQKAGLIACKFTKQDGNNGIDLALKALIFLNLLDVVGPLALHDLGEQLNSLGRLDLRSRPSPV